MEIWEKAFDEHRTVLEKTAANLAPAIRKAAEILIEGYRKGGKVLLLGNGGSASDALHIEGELLGRFEKDRKGLPAIALGGGLSTLTAVANDYSYDQVFARLASAHLRPGDILMLFSTSGDSANILEAAKAGKRAEAAVIGFTGETGGALRDLVDVLINVPSRSTPRIQEMHILIGHILCGLAEEALFD